MKCRGVYLLTSNPLSLPEASYVVTALLLREGFSECCALWVGGAAFMGTAFCSLGSQQRNCAGKMTALCTGKARQVKLSKHKLRP